MKARTRYRFSLPRFLVRTGQSGWGVLLWFSVAASVSISLFGQQVNAVPAQANSGEATPGNHLGLVGVSAPEDQSEAETNPAVTLQPAWVITTDSDGNLRQRIKLESDFAVGEHARLGLLFGEGLISNVHSESSVRNQNIRNLGFTAQWHPSDVLKIDSMVGVSQLGATLDTNGDSVGQALIPIGKLQVHFTPTSGIAKVNLGFERSIFDLSPEMVANRAVRNQFVLHPELSLRNGWRLRALAEIGPVTSVGESNDRYNSEFTVGHKLGKASELYSTYGMLHYAQSTNAGYFSPDLAQNIEGGWSTDLDAKAFSLSLDLGLGASHAREHGASFGPWGVSAHAGSFLTWTIRDRRELSASYEYYYDQSNPAVEVNPATVSPSGAWHMSVVTVSFRWATR